MFIDEPAPAVIDVAMSPAIPVRALLQACATEAERHARQIALLDEAFGTALAPAGTTPQPDRLLQTLHRWLQQIDSLRQEAQGLAAILHLVASTPMDTDVPADCIRSCTPLVALRDRLLSTETTAARGKMTERPGASG